jgi:hypothetical protein
MNIPNHISERLGRFVGLKIFEFFVVDPDPGPCAFLTLDPGSGMEKFDSAGSATLIVNVNKTLCRFSG